MKRTRERVRVRVGGLLDAKHETHCFLERLADIYFNISLAQLPCGKVFKISSVLPKKIEPQRTEVIHLILAQNGENLASLTEKLVRTHVHHFSFRIKFSIKLSYYI